MSGVREPGERQRYLDAGMDEYFEKPISLRKISGAIEPWLALRPGQMVDAKIQNENEVGQNQAGQDQVGQNGADAKPDCLAGAALDLNVMIEIYGSIGEDAKRMFALFDTTVAGYVNNLLAALDLVDVEAAITATHSAAGASRTAGAQELGQIFSGIETLLHDDGLPQAISLAAEIPEAMRRFKAALAQL